ncbi:CBS domain-containing protein cbsx1, chloroplastic [Orobanche minor]
MTSIARLELQPFYLLHHTSAARPQHQIPCRLLCRPGPSMCSLSSLLCTPNRVWGSSNPVSVAAASELANSAPSKNGVYTVGDFMTRKEELHVVKSTTTVDEALEMLVENRITGFPVIDDDWKLVGLVSDYDLLALDSISGTGRTDTDMFPEVDSTWKVC